MAQRISRAKQRIKASGARFAMPTGDEWAARLRAVLHVLYLIFNEGYASTTGDRPPPRRALRRGDPADPRCTPALLPDDGEVAGLLALMLLTDARRPARTGADGRAGPARRAGPLAAGTRALIAEGVALLDQRDAQRRGRRVPAAGGDRRGARRGGARRRTPTGRRSSRCTGCWSA